ncbi:hypothetical protein [Bacillus pseudomycoides]|uniref:hypothetical protein n=1 Tax=Bacillus pseudomycoides TaxID=64104 RepID=UPI000BF22892|nr:hypothetical protein [Bacillus pseudomycoides]PEM69364.1 hypothetical protein CN619_21765 [Bacillus pseudomycoides]PGA62164.1 hypothetical protein COL84_13390 [Bacillus pseudomycoides]
MKHCAYCGEKIIVNEYVLPDSLVCSYCGGNLIDERTGALKVNDGEKRFDFNEFRFNISVEDAKQSVEILKSYNVFQLYVLLKDVREAKREAYMGLDIFKKVIRVDGITPEQRKEFKELINPQREEYVFWNRRQCILENILIEKQGYFPETITEDSLYNLHKDIQQKSNVSKAKRMIKSQ